MKELIEAAKLLLENGQFFSNGIGLNTFGTSDEGMAKKIEELLRFGLENAQQVIEKTPSMFVIAPISKADYPTPIELKKVEEWPCTLEELKRMSTANQEKIIVKDRDDTLAVVYPPADILLMSSEGAAYKSDTLEIYEWPQPLCELVGIQDGKHVGICIRSPEDARAVISSLTSMLTVLDN